MLLVTGRIRQGSDNRVISNQVSFETVKPRRAMSPRLLFVQSKIPCYDSGVSCNLLGCTQELYDDLDDSR